MISLEGMLDRTLSSSVVKASCTLIRARPASSHTLDERESAFSLPLSTTRCFFGRGVISSTEVAGDAVLVASGQR